MFLCIRQNQCNLHITFMMSFCVDCGVIVIILFSLLSFLNDYKYDKQFNCNQLLIYINVFICTLSSSQQKMPDIKVHLNNISKDFVRISTHYEFYFYYFIPYVLFSDLKTILCKCCRIIRIEQKL